MATQFVTLPCGHNRSYKCGCYSVYHCQDCDRYFEGVVRYPEELPYMVEVTPIWRDPTDHKRGWASFEQLVRA